LQHELKVVP